MDWNIIANLWITLQALSITGAFLISWLAFMVFLIIGPYWLFVWAIGDGQKESIKKEARGVR